MPNINVKHLQTLELKNSDVCNLSDQARKNKIRQQWLKLTLQYHPDKNPEKGSSYLKFIQINNAYQALKENSVYSPEINHYFTRKPVDIPSTAFDLLLQENIEARYNDLTTAFLALTTEEKRKAFGAHYAPFLNLAQSLEQIKDKLYHTRGTVYLYKKEHESLRELITQEWRRLIIRLFAEEYLDDFQYREALATGNLGPILATRKVLSPVKCFVALLNSFNLIIRSSASYYFNTAMTKIMTDFMAFFTTIKDGRFNLKEMGIVLVEMTGLALLIGLPFYFIPYIAFATFSLPMVATTLELIASPINRLIRPLAAYTGLSPIALTALLSAAGAVAMYGLVSTVMITSIVGLLPYVTLALSLYNLFSIARFTLTLYNKHPALGIFQGILIVSIIAVSIIFPAPIDPSQTYDVIAMFTLTLWNSISLYWLNKLMSKTDSVLQAEKVELLPLPEEPIPEPIREATLLGYKKATQSHRFFNTPENADYLKKEERTFWQQTSSFFGDGFIKSNNADPCSVLNTATN